MKAVLDKEAELGANIVIPVGDLTDHGTTREFQQWTSVAQSYRDAGIEFLPLMGNHEDSYAYSVEWIENMKHYIPEDAVHMAGAQYLNYYVIRDNVMIILLKYYNLPIAFEWIKQEVAANEDKFDHLDQSPPQPAIVTASRPVASEKGIFFMFFPINNK